MLKILPYKLASESARDIARALRVKRIIPTGSYQPSTRTKVLNWGNTTPGFQHTNWINRPEAVRTAANKLLALQVMKAAGVPVPDFATAKEAAADWQADGYRIVCRHKLTSHSGLGIQIIRPGEAIPYAPLYTKYTKKDKEYRVHVFGGRVIDFSEKRKRSGAAPTSELIRSHLHGWVFCREYVFLPEFGRSASLQAVAALGLDFGAVDLIVRGDRCWVLEVNTAPGVQGTTLQKYLEAIRERL